MVQCITEQVDMKCPMETFTMENFKMVKRMEKEQCIIRMAAFIKGHGNTECRIMENYINLMRRLLIYIITIPNHISLGDYIGGRHGYNTF